MATNPSIATAMNGGVGAAPPAAAGPPPGHSRPPLPRRPPGPHRSLKQREREAPDVDWARALQHFAGCIRADLDDLHRCFTEENVVSFAAWKRLWRDARMSAAFHVEFWESTPTATHKTILQQALDGLVGCVDERGGEFEREGDVAALIARVFALYCAYSAQLGTPKHKIDADPQDWTALLSVNCVMRGVGVTMFPTAAREARAMMHRLVVQENAFLRCLQGFGPSVRAPDRAGRRQGGGTGTRQELPSVVSSATEEDAPMQQSKPEQLKSLNDRYQVLMSRARSSGAAVSSSGTRLGGRRGLPPPQLSGSLFQEGGNDGQELIRSLTSYMEYKQKEEARRNDRVARAAAAREDESRSMLEVIGSERDDSSNILDLSDRGSIMSAPLSPTARSVASSRHELRRRSDSDGSEAFLAELESELHADISSDQVSPLSTLAPQNTTTGRHSSVISEISEADSDALADLERELEQSVDEVPSRAREEPVPAKPSSPARRKRGRNAPAAGIVSRTATRTAQISTQNSAGVARVKRLVTKRGQRDSTASRISFADSWAASSTAKSDGLAAIQAELDAIPSLEIASKPSSRPVSSGNDAAIAPAAKLKAKQMIRQFGRNHLHQRVHTINQRRKPRSSAISIASESSELIDQLQTELDYSAPNAKTSAQRSTPANGIKTRRSSRLSSMASDTGSNALEELERELNATTATLAGAPQPPLPLTGRTKTASRERGVASSKRPAQQSPVAARGNAKKARTSTPELSKTGREQRGPIISLQSTRKSAVSSDTESDGLAELMSELDTPVATEATATQRKNLPAKKTNAQSTARRKTPTSSKAAAARPAPVRSKAPPSAAASSVVVGLRRSARLSSVASDTESDGLEDLMAELESAPGKKAAADTKPSAAAKKLPTRPRGAKTKGKQAKTKATAKVPVPRKTRTPRAPRQTQRKPSRTVSQKEAATPHAGRSQASPVVPPSSRRSTRSSSVALDTDSDGLAELEAELQAGERALLTVNNTI